MSSKFDNDSRPRSEPFRPPQAPAEAPEVQPRRGAGRPPLPPDTYPSPLKKSVPSGLEAKPEKRRVSPPKPDVFYTSTGELKVATREPSNTSVNIDTTPAISLAQPKKVEDRPLETEAEYQARMAREKALAAAQTRRETLKNTELILIRNRLVIRFDSIKDIINEVLHDESTLEKDNPKLFEKIKTAAYDPKFQGTKAKNELLNFLTEVTDMYASVETGEQDDDRPISGRLVQAVRNAFNGLFG